MTRSIPILLSLLAFLPVCLAGSSEGDELTGVYHAAVSKEPAHLEIDGHGFIRRLIVTGSALRTIPDRTRIWVRGTIKTKLYGSSVSAKQANQAAPTQWFIFMAVDQVKRINDTFEIPEMKDKQNKDDARPARVEMEFGRLLPEKWYVAHLESDATAPYSWEHDQTHLGIRIRFEGPTRTDFRGTVTAEAVTVWIMPKEYDGKRLQGAQVAAAEFLGRIGNHKLYAHSVPEAVTWPLWRDDLRKKLKILARLRLRPTSCIN